MKTIKQTFIIILVVLGVAPAFGQTNLNFNRVTATSEGAIRLSWNSTTNEVYEIDYADALKTNADGTTAWNILYTDYPSHGTNTFVTDAGNYDMAPEIPHPSLSPQRFYRIALIDTNTSPTNPAVSITFPTNNASLSGDVTMIVSASSPEMLTDVELYIDGEQQWISDDGTNFLVNTCEWPNGSHTLFAIAKSQSSLDNPTFGDLATIGRSVSSYVNVTFDNLIHDFDLSEPFFEPSEGQIQKITASFIANVNWTLEIQDLNSNDVRLVTGTGSSMEFDWDGTGTNGAAIPDGLYEYLLTVQTNGLPVESGGGNGGGTGGSGPPSPPSPAFSIGGASLAYDTLTLPLPPLPPGLSYGVDNNGNAITNMTTTIRQPVRISASASLISGGGFAPAAYSSNVQSTRGPKRKPRIGIKNKAGTFGVCYKTYPHGALSQAPKSGALAPLQTFVGVDGKPAGSGILNWASLTLADPEMKGFAQGMKIGGFKAKFFKPNDQWNPLDIKSAALGGNSIFNTCNFGMLLTHGCYGSTAEIDGVKYTYLFMHNEKFGISSYVRFADMDLGSGGTNGLRWMTILACNTLHPENVTSMRSNGKFPMNDNLHLLLGGTTVTYVSPYFGLTYASNMVFGASIKQSFINTGQSDYALQYGKSYNRAIMTNAVAFRVMGYNSCIGDTLYLYNDPDTSTIFQMQDTTVFTPSP